MLRILEYQFPFQHQLPITISEIFENYRLVKTITLTFKKLYKRVISDFNTFARTVFDLAQKNQWKPYLNVLRLLALPQILVVTQARFLKHLRGTAYSQLINLQDSINKSDFDIFHTVQ